MRHAGLGMSTTRAVLTALVGLAVFSTSPFAPGTPGSLALAMTAWPDWQTYRVAQDADDGTEHQGLWYVGGYLGDLDVVGRDWHGPFIAAFRFTLDSLEQGQCVKYARLRVASQGGDLDSHAGLVIRGVLEPSAEPLSQDRLPSVLAKTSASVPWHISLPWRAGGQLGLYYASPDIAPVVNEILALPGWGSGGAGKAVILTLEDQDCPCWERNCLWLEDSDTPVLQRDPALLEVFPSVSHAFVARPIPGKPTDRSVAIGFINLVDTQTFAEYGPDPYTFPQATASAAGQAGRPVEIVITDLVPDSTYWYRIRYKQPGDEDYLAGPAGHFHTQRAPPAQFVFTIQADSHVMDACTDSAKYDRRLRLYGTSLSNAAASCPDFHVELGDFASIEFNNRCASTGDEALERYLRQRRCLDALAGSVPFYLVLGNHDGEQGWRGANGQDSLDAWGAVARKKTVPNPVPDFFYSGASDSVPSWGKRANYYAWEWGDALFVVLDACWYTTVKPHCYFDDGYTYSNDEWDWTLGWEQYQWLYSTLHASTARWKFVFAHHVEGGARSGPQNTPYGRGGIEVAKYRVAGLGSFEWGGENARGAYRFGTRRPGWSHGPVHDMMVEEGVTIFFHGHDHVFMHQALDGVVYQTCPQPADINYTDGFWAESSYSNGAKQYNAGHLRVTVGPGQVQVEYVRSVLPEDQPVERDGMQIWNGDVTYSYVIDTSGAGGTGPAPPGRGVLRISPNPFSGSTQIRFCLPAEGRVAIDILDVEGRLVDRLVDGRMPAGVHGVWWNRSRSGNGSAAGVYFCRLAGEGASETRKVVRVR